MCKTQVSHWTELLIPPDDIMSAILPEAEQDEFPTGFSIVGHVGASVIRFLRLRSDRLTH